MNTCAAINKLNVRVEATKSLLCIGLDADLSKVPDGFYDKNYPQFEFNKWIIDQTHQFAAAYKPNLAFYEGRGSAGWWELEMTMRYLRENYPDIFTIADGKRADIGSTNVQYAVELFENLEFDAVTLHPYVGQEALQPFLDYKDKVSIVLCKTSNSGSGEFQDLLVDGEPLWKVVARQVSQKWNSNNNCMLVVGATYPETLKEVRQEIDDMWLLVPGVGEQGGEMKTVIEMGANSYGKGVLINVSRGIIYGKSPHMLAQAYSRGV